MRAWCPQQLPRRLRRGGGGARRQAPAFTSVEPVRVGERVEVYTLSMLANRAGACWLIVRLGTISPGGEGHDHNLLMIVFLARPKKRSTKTNRWWLCSLGAVKGVVLCTAAQAQRTGGRTAGAESKWSQWFVYASV